MAKKTRTNLFFLLVLILYIGYAGYYIYRTSFVVDGERYFVLFDDAMISMRYAKNIANGFGAVWNPGENPVEGFTNPLWVFMMAFFHLFPIPASKISLAMQISGGLFLLVNLFFVRKIAELLSPKPIVPFLAMFLTAFYVPLNNWGLQGMEVSLLMMLVTMVTWMVLRNLEKAYFSPWPYLLLGLGTLVRIDMAVPYLVMMLFLLLFDSENRKSHFIWGCSLLLVFLGSQTTVRVLYYGDVLPNTYYLKMTGLPLIMRLKRGGYVLFELIRQMNWVLILIPFSILLFRRNRNLTLLFLVILGQIAYSVYVGGDAWEHKGGSNRYISLAIPLFFILFVTALDHLMDGATSKTDHSLNRIFVLTKDLGVILFVFASLLNFNFLVSQRSLERMFLLRQPDFIEANKEYIRISKALTKFTTPDAHIAVVTAGAIPYFTDLPSIDLLGKNDPVIAHQENHIPDNIADIRPGHMKWDYQYSIGELEPDVVVQLWGDSGEAEKILEAYYTVVEIDGMLFSARTGSTDILWERVEIQP